MGLSSKQVCDDQQLFDNWSFQEPPPRLPTTVKRQQNHHHHNQPPPPALNCPRCDSSNTKFCYYNNYNKSQPRHFCKSCKRHWTNGGTLRNVPIGGGRKNKRHKPSPTTTTTTNNNNQQIIMSSMAADQSSLCLYKSADDSNLVYQAMSTSIHDIDRDRRASVIFDVENVMNYLPSTTNHEFSWSSNSTTRSSNMNIGASEGGMIIGDDVCWELEPSSSSYWNWNVGFDDDDDHATLMLGGSEGGGGLNNVVLSNWDEMDQMIKP